jgi:hypothetical protein
VAYLLYTIYEADFQLRVAGNFYHDLGLHPSVGEREVQSRFRRLTLLHHPDKIDFSSSSSSSSSNNNRQQAESYYLHLKLCRDILVDPVKRFAYDRLGPDMLAWQNQSTIPDYISTGLRNLIIYYTGTTAALLLLGFLGYVRQAAFWRFLALACLALFELHVLTSAAFPRLLAGFVNPVLGLLPQTQHGLFYYLPFQLLSLLRKLLLTLFIAFAQIGPLLQQQQQGTTAAAENGQPSQQQLQRLALLSVEMEKEAAMLMNLEMTPFAGDAGAMRELRDRMKRFLVDNTVRSHGEVRSVVGRVLERRRQGVPHGAVGSR